MKPGPNVRTPGCNPANAEKRTYTLTLPARQGKSNPGASQFQRLQLQFAATGRTLVRTRRMHEVFTTYRVEHRGDARHFDNLSDVRNHLAQIGGKP